METVVKTFSSTPTLWGCLHGRVTPCQSDQVPTGLAVLWSPGVPNPLSSAELKNTAPWLSRYPHLLSDPSFIQPLPHKFDASPGKKKQNFFWDNFHVAQVGTRFAALSKVIMNISPASYWPPSTEIINFHRLFCDTRHRTPGILHTEYIVYQLSYILVLPPPIHCCDYIHCVSLGTDF